MTASTEQERAHALAEKHGATSYRNRADTSNPAFGFTLGQLEALISEVEQAATRAPVVPQDIAKLRTQLEAEWVHLKAMQDACKAMLVAAPVQLPEPVAKVEDGGLKWHIPDSGYSLPVRYLQGTHKLYTEQQVRQLLAAHGIEVAP